VQQISALTAASRVLAGADPRLVAMGAAFSLPYGRLVSYTRDPFGGLASEHYGPLVDGVSRRSVSRRTHERAPAEAAARSNASAADGYCEGGATDSSDWNRLKGFPSVSVQRANQPTCGIGIFSSVLPPSSLTLARSASMSSLPK
jgi:hypothetical protein